MLMAEMMDMQQQSPASRKRRMMAGVKLMKIIIRITMVLNGLI